MTVGLVGLMVKVKGCETRGDIQSVILDVVAMHTLLSSVLHALSITMVTNRVNLSLTNCILADFRKLKSINRKHRKFKRTALIYCKLPFYLERA